MHIHCPHCQNPIEIVGEQPAEVICSSCGSSIMLDPGRTRTFLPAGTARRIGKFELLEHVGTGAFGNVYKARDTELDRIVAIKIPRAGSLTTQEDIDRCLREARSAAQLKHPCIVSLYDAGQSDGSCYLISEFVQGATLTDRLSAGRLTFRQAAELVADVADAVHFAHEHGVVHRDLKPSNIMIDLEGRPHLMDFGLAKRDAGEITMTLDGQVLGTPAYMSPEQAGGAAHRVDARSDVYSLGVILYELLTGELPFRGNSRMLIVQVLQDEPRPPRRINDRIPRDLETVCLKAMAKSPTRRYTTAAQFAADLRRWLRGEAIHARPIGPIGRAVRWCRRQPVVATLIAMVVLVAVIGFAGVTWQWRRALRAQRGLVWASEQRLFSQIEALFSCTPESVPIVLEQLKIIPAEGIVAITGGRGGEVDTRNIPPLEKNLLTRLRWEFEREDAPLARRLRAAYGLAALGFVELGFLIDSIPAAQDREAANVIQALQSQPVSAESASRRALMGDRRIVRKSPGSEEAAALLVSKADEEKDPTIRRRFASTALFLGDPRAVQSILALGPDPRFRTTFIHEFGSWRGNLTTVAELVQKLNDPAFQSGLCLATGLMDPESLEPAERQQLADALRALYQKAADGSTHSASAWALRKWTLDLPVIEPSRGPVDNKRWFVNSYGMTMLEIPAGSSLLGEVDRSLAGPYLPPYEYIQHDPLFVCDREIWNGLFEQFTGDSDYPSSEKPVEWQRRNKKLSPTADCPVVVTWFDAIRFCNWLSLKEGREPCYRRTSEKETIQQQVITNDERQEKVEIWTCNFDANGYRLLTAAEWEYACRTGTTTAWTFGDDERLLPYYAVFSNNAGDHTRPGGEKLPNAWGLFDMHGNVDEWCWDKESSGRGWRVARGGGWDSSKTMCRSSFRFSVQPSLPYFGFRVACRDRGPQD